MIPLRIRVNAEGHSAPFVIRLNTDYGRRSSDHDAFLVDVDETRTTYQDTCGNTLAFHELDPFSSDGDVLIIVPARQIGHRVIRVLATDNTLVFTERCDQRCIMCAQPPSATHHDITSLLEQASLLAPPNAILGISGGEPTLYKGSLLAFLQRVSTARPDIAFHILSNGQHFGEDDLSALRALNSDQVSWGIPIYAAEATTHDEIVRKPGAFQKLCNTLELMCRSGSAIELRTVVMTQNIEHFGTLSQFISTQIPFAARWAIMQMENAGFAGPRWSELFVDTSEQFSEIGNAVDLARTRGLSVFLYNFPLCTIPNEYRGLAPATISDWKQRFLPVCSECNAKAVCCGFFEWYREARGFVGVHAL